MTGAKPIAQLRGVAARVSDTLAQNERIRVIWLTGSVARGTADASSDVDLRIAVTDESYQKIGETACYSLLAGLMLMENGFDRLVISKRRVWAYLNEEQRDVLRTLAPITHDLTELANGRIEIARIFLPHARRLMAKYDLPFPEEFEVATWLHLKEKLGIDIEVQR